MKPDLKTRRVYRCRGCGAYLDLEHTQHGSHVVYEQSGARECGPVDSVQPRGGISERLAALEDIVDTECRVAANYGVMITAGVQKYIREQLASIRSAYDGLMAYEETTGDLLWKALNRLLRECRWTRERNGFYVESRSGEGIGVAHMLREAEEAHTRYVHEHE